VVFEVVGILMPTDMEEYNWHISKPALFLQYWLKHCVVISYGWVSWVDDPHHSVYQSLLCCCNTHILMVFSGMLLGILLCNWLENWLPCTHHKPLPVLSTFCFWALVQFLLPTTVWSVSIVSMPMFHVLYDWPKHHSQLVFVFHLLVVHEAGTELSVVILSMLNSPPMVLVGD